MTQVVSAGAAAGTGHDSSTHSSKPCNLIDFAGPNQWWKLTLDVDEKLKHPTNKLATEINAHDLANGYTLVLKDKHGEPEPHFDVLDDGGPAVRFRSYLDGALTGHTGNPRTELREMTGTGDHDEAGWTISTSDHSTHRLTATVKVTHAPSTPKHQGVVIGQIHTGKNGGNFDLLEIMYDQKRKAVGYRWDDGTPEHDGVWQDELLVDDYEPGSSWFTYRVTVSKGTVVISVDVHDGHGFRELKPKKDVSAKGCYFKAGAYTQSHVGQTGAKATDYGEALFRSIVVDQG